MIKKKLDFDMELWYNMGMEMATKMTVFVDKFAGKTGRSKPLFWASLKRFQGIVKRFRGNVKRICAISATI